MAQAVEGYVDQFDAFVKEHNEPAPLTERRRAAIDRFQELGIPGRRDENWKYSPLTRFTREAFSPATGRTAPSEADLVAAGLPSFDGPRLVFVDGRFAPTLSRIDELNGVEVRPLSEALQGQTDAVARMSADETAFASLNGALFTDGAFITVADDTAVETPVAIIYCSTGHTSATATHVRNLLTIGRGSRATFVESYRSLGTGDVAALANSVTEVSVGANSRLDHVKVVREESHGHHLSQTRAKVESGGNYANHFFTFGTGWIRNEIDVRLEGEQSHTDLNGLYVTDDEEHVDCFTSIHHLVPHCTSWEMYRGVIGGRSTGNFRGKIDVYPDAQKTDAKQSSNHLLLTDTATANSKPCLEIYADDVRCTHGATIGQLDDAALFYLRSRGLPELEARRLLTRAFAGEVLDVIVNPVAREHLEELMGQYVTKALRNAQESR